MAYDDENDHILMNIDEDESGLPDPDFGDGLDGDLDDADFGGEEEALEDFN